MAGAEVRHQLLHAQTGQGVERGERLVEEEQLGLAHQGAGQGDPLRLAARERARPGVGLRGEPDLLERRGGSLPRGLGTWKTQDHVAPDPLGGHQAGLLEDDGAHLWHEHVTCPRRVEPGQNTQQRGLATSRRAEQSDELSLGHGDVEVGQDVAGAEGLGHTVDDGGQVGSDGGEGFIGPPGAASTAC